ncbi:MAG: iron chelate uptake ABC transporter family permease subunit, partial [Microvirga sp.]
MSRAPSWRGPVLALGFLLLCTGLAFVVGRYPVTPADVVRVLWSRLVHSPSDVPGAVEAVILNIRGPRVAAAILIGCALATAG